MSALTGPGDKHPAGMGRQFGELKFGYRMARPALQHQPYINGA